VTARRQSYITTSGSPLVHSLKIISKHQGWNWLLRIKSYIRLDYQSLAISVLSIILRLFKSIIKDFSCHKKIHSCISKEQNKEHQLTN
jgi:hypothetical protein